MLRYKFMATITVCISALLFQGCSMNQIKNYQKNHPVLMMEDYFTGHVKGYGLIQKYTGGVRRRFTVDMHGHWTGDHGILDEDFIYDDGEKQHRQWQLTRTDAHHFNAVADDVTGITHGEQYGNAIHMVYALQIPYKGKTIDVTMDDWLYRVNDQVVLNNAVMKKFGIPIGRITASFFKE